LIERVPPTCPASTPDPVTARMAVTGSGVSPRQATLEAPVLPANRRSRRQPPGRRRTRYRSRRTAPRPPSPDSDAGAACERRRPEPRSCRQLVRRRTAPCGAPTRRSSCTQVRLATPPAAAFATGQCSRPGGRLRATASVANQESHARPKQKCDGCRQPRVVRFAHRPGNAAVPRRAARRLSAWQRHSDAGAAARTKAVVARQDAHAWLRGDRARAPSSLDRQPSKHGHVRA